jgi:hypothetical protein
MTDDGFFFILHPSSFILHPLRKEVRPMETETKRHAKEWTKPELLVLVRNKPEEAVLVACKNFDVGPGPALTDCYRMYEGYCAAAPPS